ncbi:MAG: UDP-N-acetylmuramoyl-tripeptide--D-alanyl-D-alanine ligase [Clostridia bacterium]|nr:UDP-N-acetylmuramoyl-tripeptide--D-alanyl-D-alanine ligase [Clostridia bacterium]
MKIEIGIKTYMLSDVARSCGGYLVGADRPIKFICTDSREAGEGVLFVALCGEKTDGHNYIMQVLQQGCDAVLCEKFPSVPEVMDVSAVVVPDTLRALSDMATEYIRERNVLRVAVTGSVGKTTTKEFLCAVLGQRFKCYKTEANYNSIIGMPMSVMGVTPLHEAAIFEMGMSARGEIAQLSRVVTPDVALITNVGSSHLEYLKTRENIALAKLEIVTGLRDGGLLIVNGDEPLLYGLKHDRFNIRTVTVHTEGDYAVSAIHQNPERWETVFDITTPSGTVFHRLSIPAIGTHMVYDAAYAVTIGLELGMSESEIRTGLMNYQNEKLRQTLVPVGDVTILADCYNAAPESMCEAIHVLVSYAKARGGRAVAVLGDMRELGEATRRMHETVGEEAATLGVSCLMTLGDLGVSIAEGALGAGMADDAICMVRELDDLTPAAKQLWSMLKPGDVVLLKASRAIAAERMIYALKATDPNKKT